MLVHQLEQSPLTVDFHFGTGKSIIVTSGHNQQTISVHSFAVQTIASRLMDGYKLLPTGSIVESSFRKDTSKTAKRPSVPAESKMEFLVGSAITLTSNKQQL